MASATRPLAVVTGASTGIGYELAKQCAENGFDLIVAADEPEIENAAADFRKLGSEVEPVQADLATLDGVDKLYAAIRGRRVEALLANAGRGLGKAFLDQDFAAVRRVVDTNITGTIYLIQKVGRDMRGAGKGRILITGSIAGFMPGTRQPFGAALPAFSGRGAGEFPCNRENAGNFCDRGRQNRRSPSNHKGLTKIALAMQSGIFDSLIGNYSRITGNNGNAASASL